MFKKSEHNDSSNFWISYADLMAGLLFVFILLIGAIVSKSINLREVLHLKEKKLEQTTKNLKVKEDKLIKTTQTLIKKEQGIKHLNTKVEKQVAKIKLQQDEIYKLKSLLSKRVKELNNTKASLVITKDELELKSNEIEKLNQLLLAKNSKLDALNGKIIILQNLIKDSNTTLQDKDKKIQDYKNKILVLSNNLTKKEDELRLKGKKAMQLLEALDKKQSNYENLLKELQSKREKIKYLTGIKLKAIDELKKTLGNKIAISKDGSMKLSSNILFDKGSSQLKDSSKEQLKEIFSQYINALMSNQAIAPYIQTIAIEGHTDSDGGFVYNLKLSQDRALSVMQYLLTLPIAKKYNLKDKLVASGRAYLDKIVVNGKEDKTKSRRIEIKFRLKNQNQLYEIEKILDENSTF